MQPVSYLSLVLALGATASAGAAQQKPIPSQLPMKHAAEPTVAAITPLDLMTRLYIFADDSMMGRAAGTIYHDNGIDYIAGELSRLGLKPGGDKGTYFQHIPLLSRAPAVLPPRSVDCPDYPVWKAFFPRDQG